MLLRLNDEALDRVDGVVEEAFAVACNTRNASRGKELKQIAQKVGVLGLIDSVDNRLLYKELSQLGRHELGVFVNQVLLNFAETEAS